MIEFRWVIFLTLWTIFIGPVLNFSSSAPREHEDMPKAVAKVKAISKR